MQAHQEQERKRHEQVIAVIEDRWLQKVTHMEQTIEQTANESQLVTERNEDIELEVKGLKREVNDMLVVI